MADNREHRSDEAALKEASMDKDAFDAAYERSKSQYTIQFEKTQMMDIDLNYGLEEEEKKRFFRKSRKAEKKKKQEAAKDLPRDEPEEQILPEEAEGHGRPSEEQGSQEPTVCREVPNEVPTVCREVPNEEETCEEQISREAASLDRAVQSRQQTQAVKRETFTLNLPDNLDYSDDLPKEQEQSFPKTEDTATLIGEKEPVAEPKEQPKAVFRPAQESIAEIKEEISGTMASLKLKKFFAGLLALLLLYCGMSQSFSFLVPGALQAGLHPQTYILVNLALLFCLIPVSIDVMAYGFTDLMKCKFSTMSMIFLLYTVTFVYTLLLFFLHNGGMETKLQVLAFLPAVYVWLYYAMEKRHLDKIKGDFKRLISKKPTIMGGLVYDSALAEDCGASGKEICLLDSAPENRDRLFQGFMDKAYENSKICNLTRIAYPIMIALPMVLALVYGILHRAMPETFAALTLYLGTAVLFCPELLVNLPYILSCKSDRRKRAAIIGFDSVKVFSQVDEVVLGDSCLFTGKAVTLSGIKLFGEARIDQIIVETASVLHVLGGPVLPVLMEVIDGREELLLKPGKIVFEAGSGITAEVGGGRLLMGTREFMRENRILVPEGEIAEKLREQGRNGLFVAKDGVLCAVIVLIYQMNSEMETLLQRLCDDGVRIHVKTFDPLIDSAFLAEKLSINETEISVLSQSSAQRMDGGALDFNEENDVLVSYGRNVQPQCKALLDCVRLKQIIVCNLVAAVTAVVISYIVITLLLFAGSLGAICAWNVIVYGILWLMPCLLLSYSLKFQK